MKKLLWICVLVLFISGTSSGDEQKYEKAEAVIGDDGVQRLEIEAGSYYYKPNYIIVKAGIPVELTFKKEPGITPHDVVIEIPNIHIKKDINTEGTVVKFTPTDPGRYPFYCDKKFLFFPSHRAKGMEGIIDAVQ
jgi:plastocyanin domain-containing protein